MTQELSLPRLIGSREASQALVEELSPFSGSTVILNARDLRSASPSSVDELVKLILEEGRAARLEVAQASPDFVRDVEESASARGVAERLTVLQSA